MRETQCRSCGIELWLCDEDAGSIIEEQRQCKNCLIKKYEQRILDANKHPRSCFFIGVKKASEQLIKELNKL